MEKVICLILIGLLCCPASLFASDETSEKLVHDLMQQLAGKSFKNMKPEDLPYFKDGSVADCTKFVVASTKKINKLENLIIELGEAKHAGKVTFWTKMQAVNALGILLSYAVVDRMFAPKKCVDPFDETAFNRIDTLIQYYK